MDMEKYLFMVVDWESGGKDNILKVTKEELKWMKKGLVYENTKSR